jgi:hypothetical protein
MTLTAALRDAFAAGFTQLTQAHDPGEIVGYGVCSDDDASSLYLAAHTRTARDAQIDEEPDYAVDFVWNPDEWDLPDEDGGDEDLLSSVNQAIAAQDTSDIDAHRILVWSAAVDAMAQLIDDGFFARSPEAIRVVLVMDGGDEAAQVDWNVRLNSEDRRPELAEYFGLDD